MRAIQPQGPYFLLGMCNGVHIAEQMVLELEAQGQEVGFLGVIDTFVRQHSQIRWLAYLDALLQGRRNVSILPFLAQVSHYKRALKNRFRRMLLHETEPLSPWTTVVWPGKDFQPRRFRAPVILFKGPRHPYFMVKDNEMCWGGRTLSGVAIHRVNASHEEMLREPAVQMIAKELECALHRHEKRQILAGVG
jgi:thioesterase domain-containing protein